MVYHCFNHMISHVHRPSPASPGEIHLDSGSAPLLPVGPVGVDPVATAELPSAVPLAKQALPPGADGCCCGFYLGNLGKVWETVDMCFIQNIIIYGCSSYSYKVITFDL